MTTENMVYDLTISEFKSMLKNLRNILAKTKRWAEPKKIDMGVFFQSRLAPDMFPLGKQIQICTDIAKGAAARLSLQTPPAFEDNEQTFEQYVARVEKTIQYLETIRPDSFKNYESAVIEFPWYPGKVLKGHDFLVQHAIPNFYFHMTTAYAILRANGVDLGKGDYLGEQNFIDKK